MKILTNEEIRKIEQFTISAQGVSSVELVERVAGGVSDEVKLHCRPEDKLIVLAGWGNNGADALETSRLLALEGYQPEIYLFNIGGNKLSAECAEMRDRLSGVPKVTLHEITGAEPFQWPEPPSSATIIDGLFGSGLNRPLPRTFQLLARNINESGATVISIDVPSGLFGEWNGVTSREDMMHATVTVAVEFPRLSFMLGDNADVVGKWKTLRIGYDTNAIREAPFTYVYVDKALVSRYLEPRKKFASKADFGHAALYAGSRGMTGAAVLAAKGALRAGAGKVTVHGPADSINIVQTAVPDAMFDADAKGAYISSMPFDIKYTGCGVGPGIGTHADTVTAFEKFIKAASAAGRRIVVDADGLNIIARHKNFLNFLPPLSIITPHAGEFDRIFGESKSDEERLKKAIKCAEDFTLIIVLKGHHTAIIRPDGKLMFNSSGTPAMATPGSGDVLTGILTGLMASGMDSEIAAFVGTYIHGLAGELAEKVHGQYGVTADDIAANTGIAIRKIMNNEQ